MTARIGWAVVGAGCATAALALALALTTWRPTGPWVAGVVVLIALPAVTAGGVLLALRARGVPQPLPTARVSAAGSPVLVVFAQFCIQSAASTRALGAQQVASLVLGGMAAAALAARFTGDPTDPTDPE